MSMDENHYREVTQSIKAVFDLTARVDERVKMLIEKQSHVDRRMETVSLLQNELATKVGILETKNSGELKRDVSMLESELRDIDKRLISVEKSSSNNDYKWKMIFDFVYKTVWVILVCYLLLKLNLQNPPLP